MILLLATIAVIALLAIVIVLRRAKPGSQAAEYDYRKRVRFSPRQSVHSLACFGRRRVMMRMYSVK